MEERMTFFPLSEWFFLISEIRRDDLYVSTYLIKIKEIIF